MRNLYVLVLSLFIISSVFGQEKRTLVTAKVLLESFPVSDVHIVNKNTNIGTITNNEGVFEIPMSINDSIHYKCAWST